MIDIIVMIYAIDLMEEMENRCFYLYPYLLDCIVSAIRMIILIAFNTFLLIISPLRLNRFGARSMTMMPIGVPKVAYKMPGSRGGEWVDIYQRLTRERIIFMGSEINDELANQIIGVLLV
jgi:hypothetical protein